MSNNREKVIICLIGAVLIILVWGCAYEWETVCSSANDDYEVMARVQSTDATTPPALEIRYKKAESGLNGYNTLIKLVGWHDTAQCEFVRNNLLFATSFYGIDDFYKIYYLANLKSSVKRKLEIWSREKWQDGALIWSDSSAGRYFTLSQLEQPTSDFHLSCDGQNLNFEAFVLGARMVAALLLESGTIRLDIEWRDGAGRDSLLLLLPYQADGFVAVAGQSD